MSYLSLAQTPTRARLLHLAPVWLFMSACHLVVSPSGGEPGDGTNSDQDNAEARECGDRTCADDTVCCNASCGICTAPGNVCIQIACEPSDHKATCKTVLCKGSETCMETPAGAVCVAPDANPCNLVDCQPNSTCKVEQGAPVCTPVGGGNGDAGMPIKKDAGTSTPSDAGTPPNMDAGSTRDAGEPATDSGSPELDAGARDASVPPKDAGHVKDSGIIVLPPIKCSTVLCPAGTYCDDISGVPECIALPSCSTVKCSAGHHCELQQVQCVRAPCPPQPACVPDKEPNPGCDALKCKAGTHCELLECITTPCDPVATCVPDRGGCGCSGKGACLDAVGGVGAVGGVDIVCPVVDPRY